MTGIRDARHLPERSRKTVACYPSFLPTTGWSSRHKAAMYLSALTILRFSSG